MLDGISFTGEKEYGLVAMNNEHPNVKCFVVLGLSLVLCLACAGSKDQRVRLEISDVDIGTISLRDKGSLVGQLVLMNPEVTDVSVTHFLCTCECVEIGRVDPKSIRPGESRGVIFTLDRDLLQVGDFEIEVSVRGKGDRELASCTVRFSVEDHRDSSRTLLVPTVDPEFQ